MKVYKYFSFLITGFIFGAGLAIGVISVEYFSNYKMNDSNTLFDELDKSSLSIISTRLSTYGEKPNIAIKYKNESNRKLKRVDINAGLYDETGLFGRCIWFLNNVEPFEEDEVLLYCDNHKSIDLPKNTSVKVRLVSINAEKNS